MNIPTASIKWLTVQLLNRGRGQETPVWHKECYQVKRNEADKPVAQRRTFMEYSPLELQKIIDLAG
jgi:hypothetical protein